MGRGVKRESEQNIPSPSKSSKKTKKSPDDDDVRFAGKPFPAEEARERWPESYQSKAEEGKPDFIAKIVELFETVDRELYFTAQWFFRAEDTIIKHKSDLIDKKRVFYSDIKDDNPLTDFHCVKSKNCSTCSRSGLAEKEKILSSSDLYCDMAYSLPHFSFTTLETATAAKSSQVSNFEDSTMTLLDLYSGCGAMSTGLCLGASISSLKLVTVSQKVRNEAAEDFLSLLKKWEKLCKKFQLFGSHLSEDSNSEHCEDYCIFYYLDSDEDDDNAHGSTVSPGEFEVGKILAVCYGDPNNVNRCGLYFKVRWRGYGPSEDTWEPFDGFRVMLTLYVEALHAHLEFLNVGCESAFAVHIQWRSYLNILYLHEFVGKVVVPVELKEIVVCYENGQSCRLEKSIVLSDAISDLPQAPCTNFQKYIRLKRPDMFQSIVVAKNASGKKMLYDHIPLQLNDDDYERVCLIPRKKGANFRDLPGVLVGPNNKVEWDPSIERVKVSSGKPLVPNYAMKFVRGISTKPFACLWWDEFVSTVWTRAEPHKRAMLHPEQDRVLTIRENARLQGFPDWYKFGGLLRKGIYK
ncbi:DNA (cytosine-5)-methyltransferase 1 [Camellia lanceoleosa]|uniref:DNA (Cytosine-5)-methyltransferase 1 n=1 Tax=Camellia lanceoleosa TaxID=1840588 RepID=A0ACC0IYQ4_9ERIC|nr:DNA (cytosine-5)-methyltransferase 1 [Camellia lanceoleosa]